MLAGAQPVHLKDFLIPVSIGSVAGFVAGLITRAALDGEHDTAKDAASYLVNSGVFMAVGGLVWVIRQRRAR